MMMGNPKDYSVQFLHSANVTKMFSLKPLTNPLSGETLPSDAEG